MPEGLLVAGSTSVAGAVHDNPDAEPPAGPDAPKGWAWNRRSRSWQPRQRGPVKWTGGSAEQSAPAAAEASPAPAAPAGGQQRDPDPGWLATDGSKASDGKVKYEDVPQEVKDDIAGLAGLVATPILAMVQSVDPYCGGALAASFEGVLDATLPVICRSQKVIDYFTKDQADWLLWGKIAMALAPVGKAIVEHHITRTVVLVKDEKTGQVQVLRGDAAKAVRAGQHVDPTTPPAQPEYSADAYAA